MALLIPRIGPDSRLGRQSPPRRLKPSAPASAEHGAEMLSEVQTVGLLPRLSFQLSLPEKESLTARFLRNCKLGGLGPPFGLRPRAYQSVIDMEQRGSTPRAASRFEAHNFRMLWADVTIPNGDGSKIVG